MRLVTVLLLIVTLVRGYRAAPMRLVHHTPGPHARAAARNVIALRRTAVSRKAAAGTAPLQPDAARPWGVLHRVARPDGTTIALAEPLPSTAGRLDAPVAHRLRAFARTAAAASMGDLILAPDLGEWCDPEMAADVLWELDRLDIDVARLTAAIPDKALTFPAALLAAGNLKALRAAGCSLQLTGFGCGAVTAEQARAAGIGSVRLAPDLLQGAASGTGNAALVSVMAVALRMGAGVHAPGVCDALQAKCLRDAGIGAMSGPLVGSVALAPPAVAADQPGQLRRAS